MERNLPRLSNDEFDLVVVGGGIYGACTAWEAASRGLRVALLEKKDFAWATSANSLKIIHGGFRYLQHADFNRLRESSLERQALMNIAPHLVHPLPVVLPTYGHGVKGREALALALGINEVLTLDRNSNPDPQKRIPPGRVLSREECLHWIPGLPSWGLSGGIIFYDAQVYNSERLVLAFLHSAYDAGAALANYTQVTGLIKRDGRILGVSAVDEFTGDEFDVRGRLIINASGPWLNGLVEGQRMKTGDRQNRLAKAVNLVVRKIFDDYAVGLMGDNNLKDRDSLIEKRANFLFITPWRNRSLIGTSYSPYSGHPDSLRVQAEDVEGLLKTINQAYPALELSNKDVAYVHTGLLPASHLDSSKGEVQLKQHFSIHDHISDDLNGLLSVEGIKYTTARMVAVRVVNQAAGKLKQKIHPSQTHIKKIYGGNIEQFTQFLNSQVERPIYGLEPAQVENLIYNYGSSFSDVLDCYNANGTPEAVDLALLKAQVLYAVRVEMAYKLGDVVLRRTELGTAGRPTDRVLEYIASLMTEILGWKQDRKQREIEEVNGNYNFTGG
jgi:glycerol-3-phosphate dehydrogenase